LYIRRRIRDDFTRLMNRQTKVFASDVCKLEPFQRGFHLKLFPATETSAATASSSIPENDASLNIAGRLLLNVLPALAEREVSQSSQIAADALIEALNPGSISPESFFEAIAVVAENKDVLAGTDRVLAQLFSRSASSGNTKALRTSSGTDSRLFATTNGPFIIYNTIENADPTSDSSSRQTSPSFTGANSIPARASSRERKPTAKMLVVSELPGSARGRAAGSPKKSPPKLPRMNRPSKLRGSVTFADSPSPPCSPAKVVDETSLIAPESNAQSSTSNPESSRLPNEINRYQSKQASPPPARAGTTFRPVHIAEKLVTALFDLALSASQEETDSESEDDDRESGIPGVGSLSIEPSISRQRSVDRAKDEEQISGIHRPRVSTRILHTFESLLDAAPIPTHAQITDFSRIIQQMPPSSRKLRSKEIETVGALYADLASSPLFQRAKSAGLSYPEIPRPYVDSDGWRLTGAINEFNEEMVQVNRRNWVSTSDQSERTHQPLRRIKRISLIDSERIFGFPPVAGGQNNPQSRREEFVEENVAYEKVMFDVRRAAEARKLPCGQELSWDILSESIKAFDMNHSILFEHSEATQACNNGGGIGEGEVSSCQEASVRSELDENSSQNHPEAANQTVTESSSIEQAVRGRKKMLGNLRDRSSPSSSPGFEGSSRPIRWSRVKRSRQPASNFVSLMLAYVFV
jgi:hypothetical protein